MKAAWRGAKKFHGCVELANVRTVISTQKPSIPSYSSESSMTRIKRIEMNREKFQQNGASSNDIKTNIRIVMYKS